MNVVRIKRVSMYRMKTILMVLCILLCVSSSNNVCSEEFDSTNPEKEELCTIYTWLDQDDDGVITFADLKREFGGMKREHESRVSVIRTMREKHALVETHPMIRSNTSERKRRHLTGCTDLPFRNARSTTDVGYGSTWEDSSQRTCQTYATSLLCTSQGGYGSGWVSSDTFEDYADDYGYSALDACCTCGGGRTDEMRDECLDTSQPNYRGQINFRCVNFLGNVMPYSMATYDGFAIYRDDADFSASTMCCISGGGSYSGPGQYGKAKITCGPNVDQCTDVNRAIDGDLQAYPVYQSWPGTPLPDVENNGPRATNLASCNEQSYLTIELENRYVLTKIKAWGKVGSRHCGMRIAISSTGRFDGEEKTVYDAGTTSYSDVQSVKGTSIDISDREPVTHVRWWMSRTEVDTMAYFVDIKFEGYVPENCTASPHIAVHTSSTLSYGCSERTETTSNCDSQHDPSDDPSVWWGNLGDTACYRDCSVCEISSAESCNWFETRLNIENEINLGPASSRSECVQMVRDSCPNAVIAHMPGLGYGDCYCHFVANDMNNHPGLGWSSCLLSSLTEEERDDTEDVIDNTEGARFRAPDLHLSGAQFTTESVDSTSGQLWTSASVVTDAFFTALNLTSSNRNFVEVAGGGYGEVVGLRYTHAYWVKWNSESSNARTLFRGRTDRWAQLQAGTNNLGFYGDRDGAFRSSGLNVNSPSGMWQMIVITGQASDTTREFVFVLSTTGMGYACAYRRTGSTCSQFTPPSSVNVWWGDSSSSTTCYRDCVETTSIGTQHVYLGTIEEAPIFVGSTDRVATGTQIWRLGDENEGPGLVADAMLWVDKMLEYDEIEALWRSTRSNCHGTKLSSYPTGNPYIYLEDAWRPICGHYFWDSNYGCNTICENLGYDSGTASSSSAAQTYTEDAYHVGRCNEDDNIFYCTGGSNFYDSDPSRSCTAGNLVSVTCKKGTCSGNGGSAFECENLRTTRETSRTCNALGTSQSLVPYRYPNCDTNTELRFLSQGCGEVTCDVGVTSSNSNVNSGYFAADSVSATQFSDPTGSAGSVQCRHAGGDAEVMGIQCTYCENTNGDAVDSFGDDCNYYTMFPFECGYTYYDTLEFTVADMCCACGGGTLSSTSNTCRDCHNVCSSQDVSCHISCDNSQDCAVSSDSDCNPYDLPDGSVSAYYNSCNGPTVVLGVTDTCMLGCPSGFSGNGGMLYCTKNPNDRGLVSSTIQCNPNACSALVLPIQLERSSAGCSEGDILYSSNVNGDTTSCTISCAEGYTGNGGSAVCPSNADPEEEVEWTVDCAEVSCNPIYLEPSAAGFSGFTGEAEGIEGDPSNPNGACSHGTVLTTISYSACGLKCKSGYRGEPGNATCAPDATSGTMAISSISCTESSCSAYNGIGTGGIIADVNSANSCYNGIVLTTGMDPTCSITCDVGYTGSRGDVVCPPNSSDDDPPITNVTCVENSCASLVLRGDLVGDSSDGNACSNGLTLNTQSQDSCDVQCGPGYVSGTGTYVCASDASNDDSATTQLTCTEVQCNPYSFPDGVEGDDSSGAACVNGVRLGTHTDTSCDLRCMSGYEGSSESLTCADDAELGDDATTTIVCNEKICAPYSFTLGVTGGETDGCTDNITLSTVQDSQCTLSCRAGYSGSDTTLRCETSIVSGENPTLDDPTFSCTENTCAPFQFEANMQIDLAANPKCTLPTTQLSTNTNSSCNFYIQGSPNNEFKSLVCASSANDQDNVSIIDYVPDQQICSRFTFSDGMIPGSSDPCFDGIVLSTHIDRECTVSCRQGFTGVEGRVLCDSNSNDDDPPITNVTCLENSCASLVLRNDLVGDASEGNACSNGMILNTQSQRSCDVQCGSGYVSGTGTYDCASDASNGDSATTRLICTEVQCNPYSFPDGVEGDDSSGAACVNGVRLGTHTNSTCGLKCMSGYEGSSTSLTCANDAVYGIDATTTIVCIEKVCAPYSFPVGVTGGDSDGCTDNVTLSTTQDSECSLSCEAGYRGSDTMLRCETSIVSGENPSLDDPTFSCTENTCASLTLASSMYSGHGNSNPCNEGERLGTHTNTTCDLKCAEGYFGDPGTAQCDSSASNNDEVQYNIICYEMQCNLYRFQEGVEPDNSSSTHPACYDEIRLGTHTDSSCAVKCGLGFEDDQAVVFCPTNATFGSDASNQLHCVPNSCAPFQYNVSIFNKSIGTGRGVSNGCDEGEVLRTRGQTQCSLQCLSTHEGADGTVMCPANASAGQLPDVNIECREKTCDALNLENSVTGLGNSDPCTNGLELTPLTDPTCELKCAAGYSGENATVTCSVDPSTDQAVINNPIVCTENKCESLVFPRGAISGTSPEACSRGVQLTTRTSPRCRLECDNGYSGDSGFVTCPSDATSGQSPEVNIVCQVDVSNVSLVCGDTSGCVEMDTSRRRRLLNEAESGGLYNCDSSVPVISADSYDGLAQYISTTGGDRILFQNFRFDTDAQGSDIVTTTYYLDINGDRSIDLSWVDDVDSETFALRMCTVNVTSNELTCRIPAGSGVESEIKLMRADRVSTVDAFGEAVEIVEAHPTKLLDSCRVDYARPSVTSVWGCGTDGCNRTGGNQVEFHGTNFGAYGALVFIDGQECTNPIHGNSSVQCSEESSLDNMHESCHDIIRCTSPPLWAAQTGDVSLMVIQNNQFSEPMSETSSSSFHYSTCGIGNVHNPSNPQLCMKCSAGYFGENEDQYQCELCSPGRFTERDGMSSCETCVENEFSVLGSTTCLKCPEGTFSGAESDSCTTCTFWYRLPMLEYGHCEQPFVAYAVALIGFLLLLIMIYRCYKSYKLKKKQIKDMSALLKARHDDMELMSSAWLIQWNELDLKQQLASGGFGEVHRGTLRGRYDVAIKIIFDSKGINIEEDKEIRFLKRARHPRLVLFLGCGIRATDNSIFLVLEFCEEKTLEYLLYGNPKAEPPSWDVRLRLLKDAAEGMMHLHLILKTLHRDLKSPNILLNKENGQLRGKVADFGTARWTDARAEERLEKAEKKKRSKRSRATSFIELLRGKSHTSDEYIIEKDAHSIDLSSSDHNISSSNKSSGSNKSSDSGKWVGMNMTAGTGSLLWMAPEIIQNMKSKKTVYSHAVDVYSFGIILSECLELRQPWSADTKYHKFTYMIMDAVSNGVRPTIENISIADAPPGFVNLMHRSWAQEPSDRPAFDEINMILDDMQNARYHFRKNVPRRADATENNLSLPEQGIELIARRNPFTVTNFVKMMDGTEEAETKMEKDLHDLFDLDFEISKQPEWIGAYVPPTFLPYSPGKKNPLLTKIKRTADQFVKHEAITGTYWTRKGDLSGEVFHEDPTKNRNIAEKIKNSSSGDGDGSTAVPVPFTMKSNRNLTSDSVFATTKEEEDVDTPPKFSTQSQRHLRTNNSKSDPLINAPVLSKDDIDFWHEDEEMFTNSIRNIRRNDGLEKEKDGDEDSEDSTQRRRENVMKNVEKAKIEKKKLLKLKKEDGGHDDDDDNDDDQFRAKRSVLPTGTGVWGI